MEEKGKLLYGIIPRKNGLTEFPEVDGVKIYTIPYKHIVAVVSDSEEVYIQYMFKDSIANLLVKHQKVIEEVMNLGYSVIPIKFGTYVENQSQVIEILSKGYNLANEIFKKIKDKIEIDVAVTWNDFQSQLKKIGEEKEIKEYKEKLLNNSKKATIEDQMKIGVMVKNALDRKRKKYSDEIHSALKKECVNSNNHDVMDDKMIINTAFLVSNNQKNDFESKIEELNTEYEDRFNFRCIGPLPAYSFYTLEVKKMEFDVIDCARETLGLNESAKKDEIKKAFHSKALKLHPDKNQDNIENKVEFEELKEAYNYICDYCQSAEQTSFNGRYSFKEEDVEKNKILVFLKE